MAQTVPSSKAATRIRRLIAEERRLLQEKSALEAMLKNVKALRTKLKVEQMQLCTHLQAEFGEEFIEVSVKAPPSPDPLDIVEEEHNIALNKPTLNLDVNNFQRMFFNREDEEEEEDEENSEDEIGCAKEVLGNLNEQELDFNNF